TNWFVESVASTGKVGDYTQFYFDDSDNPIAIYFDRTKKALYASARASNATWSKQKVTTGAGPMSVALNERTGHAMLSWLNRPKTRHKTNPIRRHRASDGRAPAIRRRRAQACGHHRRVA